MDTTTSVLIPTAGMCEMQSVELDQVLLLIRLLSEPNRLRLFALLTRGERCVCDIQSATAMPQNLASHHLRVLREAGLIEARRDGRWAYYRVNKAYWARIYPALCRLFDPNQMSDAPTRC